MKRRTRVERTSVVALSLLAPAIAMPLLASSHREAPFITQSPKVDATDLYAFNSYEPGRENFITLVANYVPLQDAYGGPNYFSMDPNALYEIRIDNTGDAVEDVTFQFRFTNALANDTGVALMVGDRSVGIPLKLAGPISGSNQDSANFTESYTLTMVQGDARGGTVSDATGTSDGRTEFAKPLDNIGDKSFGPEGYDAYVAGIHGSGGAYHDVTLGACPAGAQDARVFVGQRTESFSVNLGGVFDLVNFDPTTIADSDENNELADKNITTLALEVHKDCLTGSGDNASIGVWTTASLPQVRILNPSAGFDRAEVAGGAWTQISRLGAPLVNEVVIGINDKNKFNASSPSDDTQFADYVTHPTLPALLNILFNGNQEFGVADIAPQNFPRNDLVTAFLTGFPGVNQLAEVTPSEMLRLNTGIAATAAADQSNLGVVAGDLAGFPNGRRPGDDVTDLALRVVMGALCHNIAVDLDMSGEVDEADNLGLCGAEGASPEDNESQAPAGAVAFADGAPQNAGQFDTAFPYLTSPISGSSSN